MESLLSGAVSVASSRRRLRKSRIALSAMRVSSIRATAYDLRVSNARRGVFGVPDVDRRAGTRTETECAPLAGAPNDGRVAIRINTT